jgi:co-chaperonin GroES (HSP10)
MTSETDEGPEAAPPKATKYQNTPQGQFWVAEWGGENTSGLVPYGKNLLVRIDQLAAKTSGGIDVPDDYVERMSMRSETGCIYAIGPEAFRTFDDGRPWTGAKPSVGDRIYFEKFSGAPALGADGFWYRVFNYNCILAGMGDGVKPGENEAVHAGSGEKAYA